MITIDWNSSFILFSDRQIKLVSSSVFGFAVLTVGADAFASDSGSVLDKLPSLLIYRLITQARQRIAMFGVSPQHFHDVFNGVTVVQAVEAFVCFTSAIQHSFWENTISHVLVNLGKFTFPRRWLC